MSQERVSCQASQRRGLTSGEVWGTSGNLRIAVQFHSERTSREVAPKLPGKFGELPEKRGFQKLGRAWPGPRPSDSPKFVSNWVRNQGSLKEGVFQKGPFSRDSREFRDSRDFREPQTVENKGESLSFPSFLGVFVSLVFFLLWIWSLSECFLLTLQGF